MDCGNGTLGALQQHIDLSELTGVVVSHLHSDHCVDLFGLDVAFRYGPFREHVEVIAPEGAQQFLQQIAGTAFGDAFAWKTFEAHPDGLVHEGSKLSFAPTAHPIPTYAVQIMDTDEHSLIYTADTGPEWDISVFGTAPSLLLSEATYQQELRGAPIHLTAAEAASNAVACGAEQLLLTHIWPGLEPSVSMREATAVFANTAIAEEHQTIRI